MCEPRSLSVSVFPERSWVGVGGWGGLNLRRRDISILRDDEGGYLSMCMNSSKIDIEGTWAFPTPPRISDFAAHREFGNRSFF